MDILLLVVLAALLAFMFWNSRKRAAKAKEEAEAKRRQTVPGAEVLLQGGLYGTIVAYDPEDLDKPAEVEIAPGVVINVHSQAILRIVDPIEEVDELDEVDEDEEFYEGSEAPAIESIDDVPVDVEAKPESDKKPEA